VGCGRFEGSNQKLRKFVTGSRITQPVGSIEVYYYISPLKLIVATKAVARLILLTTFEQNIDFS